MWDVASESFMSFCHFQRHLKYVSGERGFAFSNWDFYYYKGTSERKALINQGHFCPMIHRKKKVNNQVGNRMQTVEFDLVQVGQELAHNMWSVTSC